MTKLEKRVNLAAVVLPFAATLAAIVLLWNQVVSATDLAILAVMYVITGLGITVGYHRLLTHRAFQAPRPVEYTFAVLGSMAVQGPVIAGSGTTASTTRTPTRRATRTARTSGTATARARSSAASGTPTRAG